jgi:Domain of unknown function (DUF6597)
MRGGGGSTADRESSARVVDEHRRYVPGEPLRRYVAWYTGYRQRGVPPARHRGLPSPYLTLIFTLDEPLTIAAHPDPGQPPGEFGTLLGGLHSVPALITHAGAQSGIQVALRPLGARALLGLPAGCGYFDQAHLAREFRALAGCPPSQWLAEEFRNVQAGAWPDEGAWENQAR